MSNWKGLGLLGAAAGLVLLGVMALARLTVPDVPTFNEGFEAAEQSNGEILEFIPTAIGGQLDVSGEREGTVELAQAGLKQGGGFLLSAPNVKAYFDASPLSLAQMYYEDLAFFPEPDECEIEQGQLNEEMGLVAVHIICELVDIRDNGTITVDGYAAFPADMVIELDIPETGGTLMIGDEEWEFNEAKLLIGAIFGNEEPGINLDTADGRSIWIRYFPDADTLTLATIFTDDEIADVSSDSCTITSEQLMAFRPQATVNELIIECDAVDVPEMGTVSIEGTVVYMKQLMAGPVVDQ